MFLHYKIINLDSITNKNSKKHKEKWPYIPDHPYIILKWILNFEMLKLRNEKDDIDKIYLYTKDLSEPKYESLIKNRENTGIKHLNDSSAFIECSNTMDHVYENIDHYNPNRKRKVVIIFDNMITDIMKKKNFFKQ